MHALLAATARRPVEGGESAGGVRKRSEAGHAVRSFQEIQGYHSSGLLYTFCSRSCFVEPMASPISTPSSLSNSGCL